MPIGAKTPLGPAAVDAGAASADETAALGAAVVHAAPRSGPATVAPRVAEAALALPLAEDARAHEAADGPRVEIGRVIVEVVRDPPQLEAHPVEAPPRTAEQASRIGPIGDLRTGLRRFGWSGRRGG